MSSDGTRVAIGARTTTATATTPATCACIHRTCGTWTQVGADIDGEAADDWSGYSVSMSSDGTRVAIGAPSTTAPAPTPATCGCTPRAAEFTLTSTARLLHRCRRTARAWQSALTRTMATPATCGCTLRAAEHGPRLAPTSTARLRATTPGGRYRCPRTVRAWRSALTTTAQTPATCAYTPRAAGHGPRWAPISTARLRANSPGTRYRCPRTARAWRSALTVTTQRLRRRPRAGSERAGRGPRWATTSTAGSSGQSRCPRTARAWRSDMCTCTRRAAGRGPRWETTSLRAATPGSRYRCPRTARAWR